MDQNEANPGSSEVHNQNSAGSENDHEPDRGHSTAETVPRSLQHFVRMISAVAILLSVGWFIYAFALQRRGLTNDSSAAVASAVIGSIFLLAGVALRQMKLSIVTSRTREESFANRVPNGIMRIIAFLLGFISIFGGMDFLCTAAIVLNQEYLGWFNVSWSYSSLHGSPAVLIAEFHAFGLVITGLGAFLLWYAVWPSSLTKFSHRVRHMFWSRSTDKRFTINIRLWKSRRRQPPNSNA